VYVLLPVWYQTYLGVSVLGSSVCLYVFVRLRYCFILGSFVVLHQILRRIPGKDLGRELRKVLLLYVWLLLYMSLVLSTGLLVCLSTRDWLVGALV